VWEVDGQKLYELSAKVPERKRDQAQKEMKDLLTKMNIESNALTKAGWALSKLSACH